MLVIRYSQLAAMAEALRPDALRELARRIDTANPDVDAHQLAKDAIAVGDVYGLHDLNDLLRLSRLLQELTPADVESGWAARILSDSEVNDPRQRLLRAEDELRHSRCIEKSNARVVGLVRGAGTYGGVE